MSFRSHFATFRAGCSCQRRLAYRVSFRTLPLRPARIYGLLPHPHFHARLRVSCCGHRTMLLYGLPGLPFLQAPAASSLPVLPRSCPVSPGPFPLFPGVFRFCLCFLVLILFTPGLLSGASGSFDLPVSCGPPASSSCFMRSEGRLFRLSLETYRFWISGHHGPKECPVRYPRPQTAGVGMVRGKALPVQPVRGDCSRYPPPVPASENSVCPVSFR